MLFDMIQRNSAQSGAASCAIGSEHSHSTLCVSYSFSAERSFPLLDQTSNGHGQSA